MFYSKGHAGRNGSLVLTPTLDPQWRRGWHHLTGAALYMVWRKQVNDLFERTDTKELLVVGNSATGRFLDSSVNFPGILY
jgi:hypothetical protein